MDRCLYSGGGFFRGGALIVEPIKSARLTFLLFCSLSCIHFPAFLCFVFLLSPLNAVAKPVQFIENSTSSYQRLAPADARGLRVAEAAKATPSYNRVASSSDQRLAVPDARALRVAESAKATPSYNGFASSSYQRLAPADARGLRVAESAKATPSYNGFASSSYQRLAPADAGAQPPPSYNAPPSYPDAQAPSSLPEFSAPYYPSREVPLTPQERAGLAIVKKQEFFNARPIEGKNGAVRYIYGASIPTIICAPLHICDVVLQPGERVNSVNLGDTARWSVEPAISGEEPSQIQHLIIKPLDTGVETSLVVATSRRTYHLRLRSRRTEYMPQVSFAYPEDTIEKWEKIQKIEQRRAIENTLPGTNERIEGLYFGYVIKGKAPFRPVRVYDNGQKTIIETPSSMTNREAPVLLVLRYGPGGKKPEHVMVNYRLVGTRFIVDSIFDQAILIAGSGKNQTRVLITRRGR